LSVKKPEKEPKKVKKTKPKKAGLNTIKPLYSHEIWIITGDSRANSIARWVVLYCLHSVTFMGHPMIS
jgi:hypothetical protein